MRSMLPTKKRTIVIVGTLAAINTGMYDLGEGAEK
jgi:hypothetical protein